MKLSKLLTFVAATFVIIIISAPWASAINGCSDYAVGENRRFALKTGFVPANYTVRRTNRETYTIFVNPVFSSYSSETRKNIASCLERVNAVGLSNDQPKIELQLFDARRDRILKPTEQVIHISERVLRADSHDYSRNEQCFVYVHELLHLAGLVDEYPETAIGLHSSRIPLYDRFFGKTYDEYGVAHTLPSAFDCRSKSGSIMGEWPQMVSIEAKEYDNSKFRITCGCPKSSSNKECDKQMDAYVERAHLSNQNGCPVGWDDIKGNLFQGLLFAPGKDQSSYQTLALLNSYAPRLAPLRRAHLRRLLWPTCPQKNRLYEACTSNAYLTSVTHNGEGCLKVPRQCAISDAWQN